MYLTITFGISIFVMLFVTPAFMYQGICRVSTGSLTGGDRVKSFIPLYNLIKSDTMFNGGKKLLSISTILMIVLLVGTIMSNVLIVSAGVSSLYILAKIITYLFIASFILFYVANVLFVRSVIKSGDVLSGLFFVLACIVFPIGQYFIGGYLNGAVASKIKEGESIL